MRMIVEPDVESKYAHNSKVLVGTAILLFILIIVIIFFHTYVRFCRRRRRLLASHSLPTNSSASALEEPRLDPSVMKSLPAFYFSCTSHRCLQECAVCLSEFAEGEKGRVLPNCNHAFHAHCIDTWFSSRSTCPLCRTPVQPATGEGCSTSFPGCPTKPLDVNVQR